MTASLTAPSAVKADLRNAVRFAAAALPYPALSKRLGEEGVVWLNVLVNPDGSVITWYFIVSKSIANWRMNRWLRR
ncbi:hypothetical protein [Thermithiobacillus plumbiphilus]|uniref:Uncharacterized protein n=1 Tax=Thermithiobacillus plumbiphilus TaxID=1729899 RepID=A0ABU9D5I9_9PROT